MFILPVERALRIYGAIANRPEAKGIRAQLSTHLMKLYIDGERNEHRLTVHGLSYLRDLDRQGTPKLDGPVSQPEVLVEQAYCAIEERRAEND
jgi:hypothetical protein